MTEMFSLVPSELPPEHLSLRQNIREFLDDYFANKQNQLLHGFPGFNREFSKALAAKGWVGMTFPEEYGGRNASLEEKYIIVEELLAYGAPLTAHWIGERQSGPLLLKLGTDEQKAFFLPKIISAEISFCIGLSEPNSGSDLASVKSRAVKTDEGYILNGSKTWTSNAHVSEYMIGLFRTTVDKEQPKHFGLSQFIIDMKTPGIEIRPIKDLTGDAHFNEVFFTDVFIPDTALVGKEGDGWNQVTSELAFERSQPDRYLSCFPLLERCVSQLRNKPELPQGISSLLGKHVAELSVLREMSLSILTQLKRGNSPVKEAALVKELGNSYEQRVPNDIRTLMDFEPYSEVTDFFKQMHMYLTMTSPSFSLRGGTREVLRGIIAKGMGVK